MQRDPKAVGPRTVGPRSVGPRSVGQTSLLEFPADLSVKAMGLSSVDFESLVQGVVCSVIGTATVPRTTSRTSSGGKYLSVSVHFVASSQTQLEAIYSALQAENRVLFVL